jgi:hypothetical protein
MLGSDRYRFNKKHGGTCYAELEFLHPVGSVGLIVHSGAPEAQNVNILFFMFGWDRFQQKARWDTLRRTCVFASSGFRRSHSAFRCVRGPKHRHTIFSAWVGPVRIQQTTRWDMLCRTCVFASGGICGSRSAYRCVRAQNIDAIFFMFRCARCGYVIPHSEKEGTKPPYVCPGCSNHTYSNNMITRFHVE